MDENNRGLVTMSGSRVFLSTRTGEIGSLVFTAHLSGYTMCPFTVMLVVVW